EDRATGEQPQPDEQVAVLRLTAREQLQVVGDDHQHPGGEHREHRRRHPQLAGRRLLRRRGGVAPTLALRAGHERGAYPAIPTALGDARVTVIAAAAALPTATAKPELATASGDKCPVRAWGGSTPPTG